MDIDVLHNDDWEVRITVYRKGRKVEFNDAFGSDPAEALYNAHNDLELWADDHPATVARKEAANEYAYKRRH